MGGSLDELLRHPALWRPGDLAGARRGGLATGFPALDRGLPAGGWPTAALVEVLHAQEGIGELSLVLPALADLARSGARVLWVAPPHDPCAPALRASGLDPAATLWVRTADRADALWACEQALRSGACAAVLAWPERLRPVTAMGQARRGSDAGAFEPGADFALLRRLQLAAECGGTLGLLFRGTAAASSPSPSALRLRLSRCSLGLEVEVLKSRGGRPVRVLLGSGASEPGAVRGRASEPSDTGAPTRSWCR